MKVKGTCHCGEITYEAEVDPEKVAVCYCTDCQTMTGGTCHVNAVVADDGLRLTAGKPAEYTKTGDNGNKRIQAFCGTCGTHLYACNVEGPKHYGVRVGAMDKRAELSPKARFTCGRSPAGSSMKQVSRAGRPSRWNGESQSKKPSRGGFSAGSGLAARRASVSVG
ncbi:GFA family protein [Methyloceanibacter sp.]|jgi:hypothetical protein|uniref:GFA family protein n=1 Tax=Methyloceanibacter sp. TaxID=1965321 RepID=UPI0035652D3B